MAPFRYWGAKVRMAPWLIERLPPHEHYVEACGGSGAIMAAKPPVAGETLNDVYHEVTNFFRVLQSADGAAELVDLTAFTPFSLIEFREADDPAETDPVRRAFNFFVRMQMAVVPGRSGWSYSKTGATVKRANKPGRWASMPEHLVRCAQRFERVQITDWDVIDLVHRLDAPGVLILVDPPYIEDTRPGSKAAASPYEHDNFDHEAFIAAVRDSQHASFAVTHYPHPLYDASGMKIAGDYGSHRNRPNGSGRDVRTERLYILDRSGQSRDRLFDAGTSL